MREEIKQIHIFIYLLLISMFIYLFSYLPVGHIIILYLQRGVVDVHSVLLDGKNSIKCDYPIKSFRG